MYIASPLYQCGNQLFSSRKQKVSCGLFTSFAKQHMRDVSHIMETCFPLFLIPFKHKWLQIHLIE